MKKDSYKIGDADMNRKPGGPGHGPRRGGVIAAGEKAENFTAAAGKLIGYSKSYLPAVFVAFLCSAAGSLLALAAPVGLRKITNIIEAGLVSEMDFPALRKIFMLLLILHAIGAVLSYLQEFLMITVTQRISKKMRSDVSAKINRIPVSFLDRATYGDILSRMTNDVNTIGQMFSQSISGIVGSATLFAGSFVLMTLTNIWMMLAAVLSAGLGFAMLKFIISKSQKYFAMQQEGLGLINGHVEEVYAGYDVVRVYNGREEAVKKFDSINSGLRETAFKSQMYSGLMRPIMGFVGNLGYATVCVTGAALTFTGKTDFGTIVAFMIYIRQFTGPLEEFAQSAASMQSAAAAGERVFEFLEAEEMEEENAPVHLSDVRGEVEFKDVHFRYTEKGPEVIKGFSAKAEPGQKVAIVGPTGAGKTTIVGLLMRFHDIDSGSIRVDGVSIGDLTRENVHDLFCMVLQDTWLFEGTVRENVVYGKQNISEEDVVRVCKAAGVHHFIKTLPQGYDTVLSEEVSLSAGQRQQITIARAMLRDAPMLILDEATSSIDTRTELLIQNAMDSLMKGRTSFVIAHRLSTIRNADLILVLYDGEIVESGTHEDLLGLGGYYAELYNSQFDRYP